MDLSYIPKTLLLNEVKAGETYEIVITNFHGGSLVRYRIGDLVKITYLTNKNNGVKTPQMLFERRNDDVIDFGFMWVTEKMIWMAIEKSGVKY
jgi:phenylacetate-coenzyme A ligase PaaK-like adenylate-forming protein